MVTELGDSEDNTLLKLRHDIGRKLFFIDTGHGEPELNSISNRRGGSREADIAIGAR